MPCLDMSKSKMYILVREDIPVGKAMTAVAHASLIAHLHWGHTFDDEGKHYLAYPQYHDWLACSFKKVICKVDSDAFNEAKQYNRHEVVTESTLGGMEVALVFFPLAEQHEFFRSLPLYR